MLYEGNLYDKNVIMLFQVLYHSCDFYHIQGQLDTPESTGRRLSMRYFLDQVGM